MKDDQTFSIRCNEVLSQDTDEWLEARRGYALTSSEVWAI
jgi:hypothetical protein